MRAAGDIALRFFRAGDAERWTKGDDSPVTEADIAVDRFLAAELPPLVAGSGWLSEETADTPDRLAMRRIWIVDPIDGTRAFVEGKPEWVVSVALVEDGAPIAGVVRNPCEDVSFASVRGAGATRATAAGSETLRVADEDGLAGVRISGPSSFVGPLKQQGVESGKWHYALANRLVQVAGGGLDAALARPRAHDWDIAAAHLILEEAGARLIGFDGAVPTYNRETTRHGGLIAAAPKRSLQLAAAIESALAAPETIVT
ncbi:3'(2'),5'-bisphosphate nucleotidase CysQ [Methylopila sp. M107]|uniref:3'(2'),5'-bisphosphate nucleotidase CysQ n=1 Tax=Methylopila sp. M107 TaxID=1101190 RepID=UPI00036C1833|nr:3'(2'),5'-bisphosphate nucleotidase CysQ [Methylopila sp. M107]